VVNAGSVTSVTSASFGCAAVMESEPNEGDADLNGAALVAGPGSMDSTAELAQQGGILWTWPMDGTPSTAAIANGTGAASATVGLLAKTAGVPAVGTKFSAIWELASPFTAVVAYPAHPMSNVHRVHIAIRATTTFAGSATGLKVKGNVRALVYKNVMTPDPRFWETRANRLPRLAKTA